MDSEVEIIADVNIDTTALTAEVIALDEEGYRSMATAVAATRVEDDRPSGCAIGGSAVSWLAVLAVFLLATRQIFQRLRPAI